MTCEGLAHWNGGLAWQVYSRQRRDKPIRDRVCRLQESGPSYPVALKGRAWIAADTFQIERLETDLVAPLPEIRLAADHTAKRIQRCAFPQAQCGYVASAHGGSVL